MSTAANKFLCVCCGDTAEEDDAKFDAQYNGPICPECDRNSKWAQAYLKKADIRRPLVASDINQSNCKRFEVP